MRLMAMKPTCAGSREHRNQPRLALSPSQLQPGRRHPPNLQVVETCQEPDPKAPVSPPGDFAQCGEALAGAAGCGGQRHLRDISGKLHLRGAGTVGENLQRCDHLRAKPSCTQRTGEHASLQSINRQPGNRQPVNRHPVNRQPANRQPLNRQPVNKQTLLLPLPRLLRSWNLSSNLRVYIPNQSRCESKCRDSNEGASKT